MDDSQWIDNILIAFDDMGFIPTLLLPAPEKARAEWKANLIAAITEMDNHIDVLNSKVKYLKRRIDFIKEQNDDLERKIEAKEKATAKNIADWIAFRSFHGGYAEPVQNVLSELSDLIKRNYSVEEVKDNE